jgi:hypothetical protein
LGSEFSVIVETVNQKIVTLTLKHKKMYIERTNDEIIIRLPSYVDTAGLQRFIDYLCYKEATAKSRATQEDVDKLAKEVKKGWWDKNRRKFIK